MPRIGESRSQDFLLPKHYAKLDDPTPLHGADETPAIDSANLLKRRRVIEPWLCSLFQAEHLSLVLGTGLPIALAHAANVGAASMASAAFPGPLSEQIEAEARKSTAASRRGSDPNIEDRLRSAMALYEGLRIATDPRAAGLREEIDRTIYGLLTSVLKGEEDFVAKVGSEKGRSALDLLRSFLVTFASRAGTRDRLHVFTTNYDRFIEFGCDRAGIRIIDRFVGTVEPVFRASRLNIDMHYNPPGIRGEPRYLEGVVRTASSSMRSPFLPLTSSLSHTTIPGTESVDSASVWAATPS